MIAAGIFLATALTPAVSAQAATPGQLMLCAYSFRSAAVFPGRGGIALVAETSECAYSDFGGTEPEQVDVYVSVDETHAGAFIGSFTYDGRQGAKVCTDDGPVLYAC